ncbi:hypothetical protein PSEUDO8O_150258 [Pseudomonas sp. 8O]|nr:hypothetical protein PSEUDO8O_150258 [Pseudomonas sp. 8O]
MRSPGSGRPAAGAGLHAPVVSAMSGRIGLREEARAGHLLALRIAWLFRDVHHGQWAGSRVDSRFVERECFKDEKETDLRAWLSAAGEPGTGR